RFNREWHVVCENPILAKRFQVFLDHDFRTASTSEEAALIPETMPELLLPMEALLEEERAAVGLDVFPPQKFTFTADSPLTVQPILTPDNYLEVVLKFLRKRPRRTLYFQNQSLNPIKSPTPEFKELMGRLVKYSNDPDLDVRFIFRNIGPIRKKLESLQAAGFNMERIRTQAGCHTKGIIVDSETILLGSHNVTNQGVQANRDASLLIRHAGIAKYYEKVFLHDWEKLSKPTIREELVPIPISDREAASIATFGEFITVPFSYFEEE
ncbi:MAG: phospholipase D-like domain-containing protein, partial [Pyrinomonadaceae bacterium]